MTTDNRRRAGRIQVDIRAKLMTHVSSVDAEVCDLSRTGIRLRLSAQTLGVDLTPDLEAVEAELGRALPAPMFMTLDHDRLGPLVQRLARLLRLGIPKDQLDVVDICCSFAEALTDEEAQVLGLPLPSVEETVEVWKDVGVGRETQADLSSCPAAGPEEGGPLSETASPPRHRYRVLVSSTARRAPPSIFCYTDLVTSVGVRIRVPRTQLPAGKTATALRATDLCTRLVKRYGPSVDVQLHDGDHSIWSGAMKITGAELPRADASEVLLSLGFVEPLRLSEMRSLGLLSSAA